MNKFRVYSELSKSYIEDETFFLMQDGSLLHWNNDVDRPTLVGLPKTFVVEFSTGRKDKNGTEIYDGDILEDSVGERAAIFWSKKDAAFEFETGRMKYIDTERGVKIVGNIHDEDR